MTVTQTIHNRGGSKVQPKSLKDECNKVVGASIARPLRRAVLSNISSTKMNGFLSRAHTWVRPYG